MGNEVLLHNLQVTKDPELKTKLGNNFLGLDVVATVTGADIVPILQNGNKYASVLQVRNYVLTTLGTAALKNIPVSGNADVGEVVLGSDSRLSDSRTPKAHAHNASEINAGVLDVARLPTATLAASGVVKLSASTASNSNTEAATSGAVKAAYDLAAAAIPQSSLGVTVPTLVNGLIPSSQLPSYVDDVVEFPTLASFPAVGESSKIYIDISNGKTYRWTGSTYLPINDAVSTSDKSIKLATARTISATGDASWSVSFDGSGNVTSNITLANTGIVAGTYTKVTVNAKGLATVGDALAASDIPNLDWSKISSGKPTTLGGYGITDGATKNNSVLTGQTQHAVGTAAAPSITFTGITNQGIYSASATVLGFSVGGVNAATIDNAGNFLAVGNVSGYSDERLKAYWRDLPDDFISRIALIKMGKYFRIDSNEWQVGVSAQSLMEILPEAVRKNEESGLLSVAYGNAALATCVELARNVVALQEKIKDLEKKLSERE